MMDKIYKLLGGLLMFIGLIGLAIAFKLKTLALPTIIGIGLLLYGGYKLANLKNRKTDMKTGNRLFVKSAIKKIIFILFFVPFLLYIIKGNMDEQKNKNQLNISDAKNLKGKITIGYDGWDGYKFMCSTAMMSELQKRGYLLKCIDTGGNFEERFRKLKNGKFDFALSSMDTLMTNSNGQMIGAVVALIDESDGGDAILSKKFTSINQLKNREFTVGFIENTPSSFFWNIVSSDFNLAPKASIMKFKNDSEIENSLQKQNTDVLVTWEPLVSKAKALGYKKLIGSENISGLIIDILVASKSTLTNESEKIDVLLSTYFALYPRIIKKIDGVKLFGINENKFLWNDDFVLKSLLNISKRLNITLDNPYLLINSSFVNKIIQDSLNKNDRYSRSIKSQLNRGFTEFEFDKLSDNHWQNLQIVGNLKQEKISFNTGTAILTIQAKEKLENIAQIINQYRYRVLIKGHTSLLGDEKINLKLSNLRSLSVYNYLTRVLGIDRNRLKSVGIGSREPLERRADEGLRNYNKRLKRVEFIFLK